DRGQVGCTIGARDGAFLWQDGVLTRIGPASSGNAVSAINERGQVVGWIDSDSYSGSHAFLWQNGVVTDLNGGQEASVPSAINERGQVVGVSARSTPYGDVWSAVVWMMDGS